MATQSRERTEVRPADADLDVIGGTGGHFLGKLQERYRPRAKSNSKSGRDLDLDFTPSQRRCSVAAWGSALLDFISGAGKSENR